MTKRVADERKLKRAFEVQADHCVKLGAPFNARVCGLLPDILEDTSALGRRVLGWSQDSLGGDLVPLRCCAGFHALARKKRVAALFEAYPPNKPDDAALGAALRGAIAQEDAYLADYLDSAPQTNEIGRSGVLLGGLLALSRIACRSRSPCSRLGPAPGSIFSSTAGPMILGEAGSWGPADARGECALRLDGRRTRHAPETLDVVSRAASDLSPLDPAKPDHRDRLLSYIWPDQTERLERTIAALDIAAASGVKRREGGCDRLGGRPNIRERRPARHGHRALAQRLHPICRRAGPTGTHRRDPVAWRAGDRRERRSRGLRWSKIRRSRAQCELRLTLCPGGETQ